MHVSICVQVHIWMLVCHSLPGKCFSSGFNLVFLFFYFLKIIFHFRNKFARKPAPLPQCQTGCSCLLKPHWFFLHTSKQELLRMASKDWSLSLSGGMPWWPWRRLCQNEGLWLWDTVWFFCCFFPSSNLKRHSWVTGTVQECELSKQPTWWASQGPANSFTFLSTTDLSMEICQ